MALRGSLDDVPIVDVLQFVHLSGKSGVLQLTSPEGQGRIELSRGNVVFAQAPGGRTIGELLAAEGAVSAEAVARALAAQQRQQERGTHRPLGQLLMESGAVTREALEACVRKQIQDAMLQLAGWSTGEFHFGQDFPPAPDDIRFELGTVLPELTVNTQFLLLEAARMSDERADSEARSGAGPAEAGSGSGDDDASTRGRILSRDPRTPQVAVELEPLRVTPPPPRVFAETPPPEGSPLELPPTSTRNDALALVGFERESWPALVRGLKALRWPVLGHAPVSKAVEAVDAQGRLAGTRLLLWRVRSDSRHAFEPQRRALEGVQRLPRPPVQIVLAENLRSAEVAELYGAGARVVLPIDGLPPEGLPPGLATVLGQLRRERQRAESAQAAELRAWLHAKRVTSGMQQALQRANIALEFMRVAASSLERAVLFLKKGDELIGLGAFGTTGTGRPMADALRGLALRVPADGKMANALRGRRPLVAPPDDLGLVPLFFDIAGRPSTDSATLVPLSGPSRTIALLYGDNGPVKRPIGNLHPLEIAAGHAGIAYENALLRLKLGMPLGLREEEEQAWLA